MIDIPDDRTLSGLGRHQLLDLIVKLRVEQPKAAALHAAVKRFFTERLTLEVTDDLRAAYDAYDEKKKETK